MQRDKEGGFTFIEILMVVILLGVVSGLAIPHFSKSYANLRLYDTANNIAYFIRYAQSRAVIKGRPLRMVFGPSLKKYWLEQEQNKENDEKEPEFARITGRWGRIFSIGQDIHLSAQEKIIMFYPDGKIDKNEISVCRGESPDAPKDCIIVSTQWQQGQVHLLQKRQDI